MAPAWDGHIRALLGKSPASPTDVPRAQRAAPAPRSTVLPREFVNRHLFGQVQTLKPSAITMLVSVKKGSCPPRGSSLPCPALGTPLQTHPLVSALLIGVK